ncbi:MAG: RimK/LysX family protein [Pseudomonadota bacterium]
MTRRVLTLGWREWVALPDLSVEAIKTKVDTGARTSALHAVDIEPLSADQVAFSVISKPGAKPVYCTAPLIDQRAVKSSSGVAEERYVIATSLQIASMRWRVEMTLTRRDDMRFRMLLGRSAMTDRIVVDPSASYLQGKRKRRS